MWCHIYRSVKRENSYLYVEHEGDFSKVPDVLMKAFGKPVFSMKIRLEGERKLVAGSAKEIAEQINQNGFFLQMFNEDDFSVV